MSTTPGAVRACGRLRASGVADETCRQADHEEAVVRALRASPAQSQRAPRENPPRSRGVWSAGAVSLLGLWLVWAGPLRLVTNAQIWALYVVSAAVTLAYLPRMRRVAAIPALSLVVLWAVWASLYPWWSAWGLDPDAVRRTVRAFTVCGLVSVVSVLLAGTSRSGSSTVRWSWTTMLLTVVPMACVEISTGWHLTYGAPYASRLGQPSGPFGNPNNLACVLVVGIGFAMGRMTERIGWLERLSLAVAVLLMTWILIATESRSALAALGAVTLGAIWLEVSRRRPRGRRHGGWVVIALLLVAALSVAIPQVRRVNPLWRLLFPGEDEYVRADTLRVHLVEIALRAWQDSPWTGIGVGRFQYLLKYSYPEVGHVVPVHNTFVEILCEMGVLAVGGLVAVLVICVVSMLPPRRRIKGPVQGRPESLDAVGLRYLAFVLLVGFVLAGVLMSSALRWPMWWLMLSSIVTLAGCSLQRRDRPRRSAKYSDDRPEQFDFLQS